MKQTELSLKSSLRSRSEVSTQLIASGDAVLIVRGRPRWLILKCPCGCGDEIQVNLDIRAGRAWRIYESADHKLSIYPSIWRETGCFSHFIIHNDQISLFQEGTPFARRSMSKKVIQSITRRLIDARLVYSWTHYEELANELGEIPWDVLDACVYLKNRGTFDQGQGELISYFRRRRSVSGTRESRNREEKYDNE